MVFVVLCLGASQGSSSSGSGFKASLKTGPRLKVSSDRLGEPSGLQCIGLFPTPLRLLQKSSCHALQI